MSSFNTTMSGVPWHLERYERQDGDERRHNHRCMYYIKENRWCNRRNGKCIGSAHCMEYEQKSDDFRILESSISNKKYGIKAIDNKKLPATQVRTKSIVNDVLNLRVSEIEIPFHFQHSDVSQNQLKNETVHIQEYGNIKTPIHVISEKGRYTLADGYEAYMAARKEKVKKIPAFTGDSDFYRRYLKTQNNGSRVKHIRYGKGTITDHDEKRITVKFDSGKESQLDIIFVLNKHIINF